jgi:hypothetical protein
MPGTFIFHHPYSSDPASDDFHLFTHLKQLWGNMCKSTNEEVKQMVKDWFIRIVWYLLHVPTHPYKAEAIGYMTLDWQQISTMQVWDFVHFTGVCIAAGEETTTKCL